LPTSRGSLNGIASANKRRATKSLAFAFPDTNTGVTERLPLSRDGWLLFATCAVRSFAYGFLSVILGLYLDAVGLGPAAIGWIFTAALAGGAVMTIIITGVADRLGRRALLIAGAALMALAGWIFAVSDNTRYFLPSRPSLARSALREKKSARFFRSNRPFSRGRPATGTEPWSSLFTILSARLPAPLARWS
jgi:MFS family permease